MQTYKHAEMTHLYTCMHGHTCVSIHTMHTNTQTHAHIHTHIVCLHRHAHTSTWLPHSAFISSISCLHTLVLTGTLEYPSLAPCCLHEVCFGCRLPEKVWWRCGLRFGLGIGSPGFDPGAVPSVFLGEQPELLPIHSPSAP